MNDENNGAGFWREATGITELMQRASTERVQGRIHDPDPASEPPDKPSSDIAVEMARIRGSIDTLGARYDGLIGTVNGKLEAMQATVGEIGSKVAGAVNETVIKMIPVAVGIVLVTLALVRFVVDSAPSAASQQEPLGPEEVQPTADREHRQDEAELQEGLRPSNVQDEHRDGAPEGVAERQGSVGSP